MGFGQVGLLQTDQILILPESCWIRHQIARSSNFFGKLGYQHDDKENWNQFEDILSSLDKIIKSGKKIIAKIPCQR